MPFTPFPPRRLPSPHWLAALTLWIWAVAATAGPVSLPDKSKPTLKSLKLLQAWSLVPPSGERFDASALLRTDEGTLYTVNDKQPGLYRIELPTSGNEARMVLVPDVFSLKSLNEASQSKARSMDLEGLARDNQGRLLVCVEGSRRIFRYNPETRITELLPLDWNPVRRWFSKDGNASWEGIAAGTSRLFVANERDTGRIVVIDPESMKVTGSFSVSPPGIPARDTHYSDLCWFQDRLWVLCRESHCVLQVDPERETVEAAFSYATIESDPHFGYLNPLPYGFVEGLAVAPGEIWLVVDNNGVGRIRNAKDVRPSLWRCKMPQ